MSSVRPAILIVALTDDFYEMEWFDQTYSKVIRKLLESGHIRRVRTMNTALRSLDEVSATLKGVWVVTSGIMAAENQALTTRLVEYAKAGGTVVYGACMPSFARPRDFGPMFRNFWDLPWEVSSFQRGIWALNRSAEALHHGSWAGLEERYAQKSLNLKNVEACDCWYVPPPEEQVESPLFLPDLVNVEETPVAFCKVGNGWLGYTGDAGVEEGTIKVLLRMFRLQMG